MDIAELEQMNQVAEKQEETAEQRFKKIYNDKKDFSSIEELKETLRGHRLNLLSFINEGKKGRKIKDLKPYNISIIFKCHFYIIKLAHDNKTIPAVYDPLEGIYTQDLYRIYTFIKLIEPHADMKTCKEVVFNLQTDIDIKYYELTKDKNLVPVNNGIYDTQAGKLLPFNHKFIFINKIATNYNEHATISPNIDGWNVDNFIKQLANNDRETELLLWQAIASVINNNIVREQAFFLYSVKGSTGKGTFQDLLINLIGEENTASIKLNDFSGRFALAQSLGKKLIVGDDNQVDAHIKDNSNFNSVITHDAVTIEQKNQPAFMARVSAVVVESFNDLPQFNNETALRRIKLILFNNWFNKEKKDKRIKNDYIKRKDVLEYVLYKAVHLKFDKLIEPAISTQAMGEYEKTISPIIDFKSSFFDMVVNKLNITKLPTTFLYGWYKRFCEYNNYYMEYSLSKFTQKFKSLLSNEWSYKVTRYNNDEVFILNEINRRRLTPYSYSENPVTMGSHNSFIYL